MRSGREITFLINSLRGGGAERVCVTLANVLAERGWSVTLVVLNLDGAVYQNRLSSKVPLVNLGAGHARTAFIPLRRYLWKARPGKILVFNHQLAVLLVLVRRFFPFRFFIIARNINTLSVERDNETSFWHRHIVAHLVRRLYRKVDRIVAQSSGMRDDLINALGIGREMISLIHNPTRLEIELFMDENASTDVERGDYILCVGRLDKQKALHLAIESFALVAADYPALRLKLVGIGPLERDLEKLAQERGVAQRVDFEGFQENIVPYYLHARATVLTSRYEGFPNVLVESTSLGTPVAAFDCASGPAEIVREGVNGYLARFGDVRHMADSIRKILARDWDREKIAATAEKYKSTTIAEAYERLLLQ
jgi:glycosyltransferase involved in cell wall biosynthesis